ncbi:hypothetical protein E4T39_07054 [Aureobasidium subglaciale]|nr:hypothetical protein E4T39_07054 [Aureobasidium subglaciale]
MADPSIITVTISVPGLPAILQAIQDLRTKYQTTNRHLQNIDACCMREPQSPEDTVARESLTDHTPEVYVAQEIPIDNTPEVPFAQEISAYDLPRVSFEHDLPVDNTPPMQNFSPQGSSPSADEGLTNTTTTGEEAAVPSRPTQSAAHAVGQKRKRVKRDMGFAMRNSAAQIAQRRFEGGHQDGPSRSESPFDDPTLDDRTTHHELTSDTMDFIPPVRPRTSMPPPPTLTEAHQASRPTSQTPALQDSIDASSIGAPAENITYSQHGRIRRQTRRQDGFIPLPSLSELNKMSGGRRR